MPSVVMIFVLQAGPAVAAVTRSSIARAPPSRPARSMPWIESDSAMRFLPASGTVSSVTRSM